MRGQFLLLVISVVQILNLVCIANSRSFVPPNGVDQYSSIRASQTTISSLNKGEQRGSRRRGVEEAEEYREARRIGSSPPSCEHKCYGCMPCQAIQVPTTTSHVGVQYANYEPEGWKCKCGPTFYTP